MVNRACQTCHNWSETELTQRVTNIQDRTFELRNRALDAMVALIGDMKAARAAGKTDADLKTAMELQRRAQFMVDFVEAENSMGFHAPEEAARILGIAMDMARQGQLAVRQPDFVPALFPSTTAAVAPNEREVTPAPGSGKGGGGAEKGSGAGSGSTGGTSPH
jgi:nitrite reductase (cytochrome c-552)